MNIKQFADKLFAKGQEAGFADMEVYVQSSSNFNVGIFKGEIDSYSLAESQGLGFRGLYNGKMGYAYTEKLDESSIDRLIEEAKANAVLIDSEDQEVIFGGADSYPEMQAYCEELERVPAADKIALAKELDALPYQLEERVRNVQSGVQTSSIEVTLINTKGLNLSFCRNGMGAFVNVIASDGKENKTAFQVKVTQDINEVDANELAEKAVREAVSLFGAEPVASGDYKVILRRDVAAQMLATFSSSFSAEKVQKGMSLLKGKVGQQIASEVITIIDDPLRPGLPGSRPFDAEGVPTRTKVVVDKGVLKTHLHNLKTARKDGVESTGNAHKASYKGSLTVAPTNFYIQEGDRSYDELIASVDEGIILISVQGLHSGANPVSGDFSLGAYGYYVKDGRIVRPINQITVAGNFFELLGSVTAVANDIEWNMRPISSPSLLVEKLAIAGK